MNDRSIRLLRWAWRAIIFVIGSTVTLFGVILFFTPGPAIVVIPLGLMILATEFAWAKVILTKVKERIARMRAASPPAAPPRASAEPPAAAAPPPPPAGSGAGGPSREG